MSKFLLIHKSSGPTSHDIIDELRQITGIKKIGHAGTLDPFASGLLIVAVGRESTRQISDFVKLDKEYEATLKLGVVSDSYDRTGEIQLTTNNLQLAKEKIEKVLEKFIGSQEQIPPMFSAKKVQGKKLYELARQGIEIERPPQQIEIHKIKLLRFENNLLKILVHCSSGTYIRSLAHDIGQALGCGAYLQELVRTQIGKYKLKDAIETKKLNKNNWENYTLQIDESNIR